MTEVPSKLLIIVHPGSACGSADMNLGRDAAEIQRLEMQMLVQDWEGGVAVIDGDLSEELSGGRSSWSEWGRSIDQALARAKQEGLLAVRVMGDDDGDYRQQDAARDLVANYNLLPTDTRITLTGAWIDDSGDGCVHSVRETLEELGFTVRIEDAMNLDFEIELDNDDGEDMTCHMEGTIRSKSPRP